MVSSQHSEGKERFRGESPRLEWVGGYGRTPFTIHDRKEPYRGVVVFWLEMPAGVVVGTDVVHPEEIGTALGETLTTALEAPIVGSPRRPDIIRVADTDLADEVLTVIGGTIPVMIAPTPEIEDILSTMIKDMAERNFGLGQGRVPMTYLNDGRIPAGFMKDLFRAAKVLYGLKPWETADDSQVIRMDIPSLGIEGACVCIIGQLGESLGVMFFSSLEDYQSFATIAMNPDDAEDFPEFEAGWLALDFVPERDLPASMLKEVADHDWPLPGDGFYPIPLSYEPDGVPVPCSTSETKIIAAGISALVAFWLKHRNLFAQDHVFPVCESFFDCDDLEVRFTFPFEAYDQFDVNQPGPTEAVSEAQRRLSETGRNDPCPCGSGKKYKRCHLRADEQEAAKGNAEASLASLENNLLDRLMIYARTRFGDAWWRHARDFDDPMEAIQLSAPWSVFGYQVDGATVFEWFLKERGRQLSAEEQELGTAHQEAWLSVWEVTEVEPGKGVTLRDLLTEEVRRVNDVSSSRTLVLRDAVLGRIVNYQDKYQFGGLYPRSLPPDDAAEVVRLARGRLGRRRAVPVAMVRPGNFGQYLIRKWEAKLEELSSFSANPPQMTNTDGHPLLETCDHYELAAHARSEVAGKLAAMNNVLPPQAGDEPREYVFLKHRGNGESAQKTPVVGVVVLKKKGLRLSSNSVERADLLRARVEKVCGKLIKHRLRDHVDPTSPVVREQVRQRPKREETKEEQAAIKEMKRQHYAAWPDESLPALKGKTPRQAVRSAQGRCEVDVLIKTMENQEARFEGKNAFDFSELRRELGLE